MDTKLEKYVERRVRELLAQGKSDSEVVQQLEAIGGRREVVRILSAAKV
jgi:hypothetical protein